MSRHSGSCSSPALCWTGQALVVAGCMSSAIYWQMELGMAGAQLYICLGFTLGWELEAESLWVSRDKEILCATCGLGECRGRLSQALSAQSALAMPDSLSRPLRDVSFLELGWTETWVLLWDRRGKKPVDKMFLLLGRPARLGPWELRWNVSPFL